LTGKTPFEYIRALRLSRAAVKLRDEDVKIIDVALDFVFDSHEGFTRADEDGPRFQLEPQGYRGLY
jgi:AraC-like DNA-binding protein